MKGFGKDGMMLLMEVIIVIIFLFLIYYWLVVRENPQEPSCSFCKDASCPSGFRFAGDCTVDGSVCGQCKSGIKTCNGNTAEEWTAAGTCTASKHIAQCVKRTDCGARTCKDGECV